VDQYWGAGYYGSAHAQLPDGRQVTATLTEGYAENHRDSHGFLSLQVRKPCVVVPFGGPCEPSATGWLELTGDQVEFDRGLRRGAVEDVTLTLTTPSYYQPGSGVPGGPPPGGGIPPLPPIGGNPLGPILVPATSEAVTVSLVFTGTGEISRHAEHTVTDCGADSTGCQSTRLAAERTADVTVTLGWASGDTTTADSDAGQLFYGQGVDAAAFLPTGEP
jgi:hypothetical protein